LFCLYFSEKALSANNGNVEQAMEYLLAHVDDEIPAAAASAPENSVEMSENKDPGEAKSDESPKTEEAAKSIKCEDCGRLFRTQLEVS
jgi:hypothetical protein